MALGRRQFIVAILSAAFLSAFLVNIPQASAGQGGYVTVSAFADWKNISLLPQSGVAQKFTIKTFQKEGTANVGRQDWSLNIGNSSSAYSFSIDISPNSVDFGLFEGPADASYESSGPTKCNKSSPSTFGNGNLVQVHCVTSVAISTNKTYQVSLYHDDLTTWSAKLDNESGQAIGLGKIIFTPSSEQISSGNNLTAFNQMNDNFLPSDSNSVCGSIPTNESQVSRLIPINSSTQPVFVRTRDNGSCVGILVNQNSDNSVSFTIGSHTQSSDSLCSSPKQDCFYKLKWSPGYLNSNFTLTQKIIPLSIGKANFVQGWEGHHLDFCWNELNVNKDLCGYIGWDSFSNSLAGINSNFVFAIANAIDYSLNGSNPGTSCEMRNEAELIYGIRTHYTTCWLPINITALDSYQVVVETDLQRGSDWFTAILINDRTGAKYRLGSLQTIGVDFQTKLSSLGNTSFYIGENNGCSSIPQIDAIYGNPVLTKGSWTSPEEKPAVKTGEIVGSCSNSSTSPYKGAFLGTVLSAGGEDFQMRNLQYVGEKSPPPKETASPLIPNSLIAIPRNLTFSVTKGLLKLAVEIPNAVKQKVTSVFLVAPSLGITAENPLKSLIKNSYGTFTLPLKTDLLGASVPIQIYSASGTAKSKILESSIKIPGNSPKQSSTPSPNTEPTLASRVQVPSSPTNPTYQLDGKQVVLSVQITSLPNTLPTGAFLVSPDLGYTASHPLKGTISTGKAVFRPQLSSSMAGKTVSISVYLTNSAGKSEPLSGTVTLPPFLPENAPTGSGQNNPANSIRCVKGSNHRTFTATACPPGWNRA
jgi:hypothetical protein